MKDILKMARVQLVVIILFVILKSIRPSVLNSEGNELFKLFLLSFPNFCEGVIGVLTLTGFGIYFNKTSRINNKMVYVLAVVAASIFVSTQELKIHNLGGDNIYDPNDLIYSAVGLLVGAIIVFRINPQFESAPR